MDTLEEFEAGINAYYAGEVPDGWDDPNRRGNSPFLMGWFMESEVDNYGPDRFTRDGLEVIDDYYDDGSEDE